MILINEALARKYFPNEDPIGRRLDVAMFEKPIPAEIIGVVGNVRYDSLIDESPPAVYFPHPDLAYSFMTLVVRTDGEPAAIAPAMQREIRTLDPNQPVSDVRTMNQVMSEWVSSFTLQHVAVGTVCGAGDVAVSGRNIWRDELFSGLAHARDRTATRRRRAAATSAAADFETGIGVDDRRRRARTRRGVCADAFIVRIAVWRCGS